MQWYDVALRLAAAVAVGLVVGYERERHHRPAGMKTHIMVCAGAAIVSMIQVHMTEDVIAQIIANPELASALKSDYGRLGAQVISGIGFLGAGTILQRKGSIKGLTTAATLWMVACVGLAVGMGYYVIAVISVGIIMLVLIGLRAVQGIALRHNITMLDVSFFDKKLGMNNVQDYCIARDIAIRSIEFIDESDDDGSRIYRYAYTIQIPRNMDAQTVIREIMYENGVAGTSEITE
jgi:putative Mg2+ transporter-C (MgtC) family protein